MNREAVETVVIGGGQAGLAVGYHLQRRGLPFVILDENARVGESWRKRWDSLRLFTPARYSGLPGMPFPGPSSAFPTKEEVAAYLEAYVRRWALPVRTGVRVDRLASAGDRFEVSYDKGESSSWARATQAPRLRSSSPAPGWLPGRGRRPCAGGLQCDLVYGIHT